MHSKIAPSLRLLFGVVAVAALLPLCTFSQDKAAAGVDYDQLVQKSKSGDPNVDYGQMRMAYASSPSYESDVDMDAVKKIQGKLQNKNYKGALAAANALMKTQYISIDAHACAFLAYQGMNDQANAEQQRRIAESLIRSILDSGTGSSVESAYKVIWVREEYNVVSALGLVPQSQSLITKNGRDYDLLKVLDRKNNATVSLYFDATIPMSYMDRVLRNSH